MDFNPDEARVRPIRVNLAKECVAKARLVIQIGKQLVWIRGTKFHQSRVSLDALADERLETARRHCPDANLLAEAKRLGNGQRIQIRRVVFAFADVRMRIENAKPLRKNAA